MKAVRYVLIAIVALIVLAVAAVAIAMAVINPNDYKPQIEQAVEDATNLDLVLEAKERVAVQLFIGDRLGDGLLAGDIQRQHPRRAAK